MYIAPNDDFCYIHINKTGGRSATAFMQQHVPGFYRVALSLVHKPLSLAVVQAVAKHQDNILAVIRNPFERYESLYCYRRTKWAAGNWDGQNTDAHHMDFPEWMDLILDSNEVLDGTQTSFLEPFPENLHCVRLEWIQYELCNYLGFDHKDPIYQMPHVNMSKRETINWPQALKRDVYKAEVKIFNYYTEVQP